MDMTTGKIQTKDIAYIGLFTALLAICSWISFPLPSRISVTLQTFGLFSAMGVLGGRRGTLAVTAYLLLGLAGAPVFAGFSGGIGAYLTPSGGYLVGFLFTALLMWGMERLLGQKKWVLLLSMVLGMIVYYAFGTAWFMVACGLTTACAWPISSARATAGGLPPTWAGCWPRWRRIRRYGSSRLRTQYVPPVPIAAHVRRTGKPLDMTWQY